MVHPEYDETVPGGGEMPPDWDPWRQQYVSHPDLPRFKPSPRPFSKSSMDATENRRWIVEGLWAEGWIPFLGGQPKVGKTTMVVDLIASLIPEFEGSRPFLGLPTPGLWAFDEGADTVEWGDLGVTLINAETPPADLDALLRSQLTHDEGLGIFHLEQMGGPSVFDLTDSREYRRWADTFEAGWTPTILIVDGVTAILRGNTNRYAEWYAAFRQFCRELEIPAALAVAHTTKAGNGLMGGTEAETGSDGLWYYTRSRNGSRTFATLPRLGGELIKLTVKLGDDGRLVAASSDSGRNGAQQSLDEPTPGDTMPSADTASSGESVAGDEEAVRAAVEIISEHPKAIGLDGAALRDAIRARLGVGIPGASAAMDRAVEAGKLHKVECHRPSHPGCSICAETGGNPHNRRFHFLLPEEV